MFNPWRKPSPSIEALRYMAYTFDTKRYDEPKSTSYIPLTSAILNPLGIDTKITEREKSDEYKFIQTSMKDMKPFDATIAGMSFRINHTPGNIILEPNALTTAKVARKLATINKDLDEIINPRYMLDAWRAGIIEHPDPEVQRKHDESMKIRAEKEEQERKEAENK